MLTYTTNQFPCTDENTRLGSAASICDDTSVYGSLRKELAMAKLKQRREWWYARVRWYDANNHEIDRHIPLRTKSKVTAYERLAEINKVENDIKSGLDFTFPWLGDSPITSVKRFTINDAVELWLSKRKSNGIRQSTIKRNRYSMVSFMSITGYKRPLKNVNTNIIDTYRDVCIDKGMAPDGININLRAVKTFLNWCLKREYLSKVPHIDMVSKPKSKPLYIPDRIFAEIMRLEWLENHYKTAFLFYRETGCRPSEPFIGDLDGHWLLISGDKTKQRSDKELHLNDECLRLCIQMKKLLEEFNGTCQSWIGNLSKTFLKAVREIDGEDTKYHLYCLRHTFAVRRYLQTRDIYLVKQEMGHASVTTTEKYVKFSLRRLEMDFPSLVDSQKMSEIRKTGHRFAGHTSLLPDGKAVAF